VVIEIRTRKGLRLVGLEGKLWNLTTEDAVEVSAAAYGCPRFRRRRRRRDTWVYDRRGEAPSSSFKSYSNTFRLASICLAINKLAFGKYPTCPLDKTFT
jgi:hypothetical protein